MRDDVRRAFEDTAEDAEPAMEYLRDKSAADEPKDDAQLAYPGIFGGDAYTNYSPEQVRRDMDRDLQKIKESDPDLYRPIMERARVYAALIERNPHPMHITVPNPAWQAWMDEHRENLR